MGKKTIKIPRRYLPDNLSDKDKKKILKELKKSRKKYQKGKYHKREKVKSFTSRTSPHIRNARRIYDIETLEPNLTLARRTGCSMKGMKEILGKGMAAYYSSGSRPNQTPQSWAYARLASALTGGKSAAVDIDILERECREDSKALKLAKEAVKKHGKGQRRVPKVEQNGGHAIRITDDNIHAWTVLNSGNPHDCVPNVFTFLGYNPRYTSLEASLHPDVILNGTNINTIIMNLNEAFREPHHILKIAEFESPTIVKVKKELFNHIVQLGECVLCLLHSPSGIGHAVAIGRSLELIGKPSRVVLFDPQQCRGVESWHNILNYMLNNNFNSMDIVIQESRIRPIQIYKAFEYVSLERGEPVELEDSDV